LLIILGETKGKNMSSIFENVAVDEDTKILVHLDTKFGDIDVRYEKWIWDGVTGESLIF